jgi:ADP-ribosylglycohydrolase
MYGAIIGDLAGSIYEYDQVKEVKEVKINNLIEEDSFYSDDTVLTIAILDACLTDKDFEKHLREYVLKYAYELPKFKPYFKCLFSPGTLKWAEELNEGNSIGNGAMMRISPIGYLFDNEEDVIKYAKLATIPSHNSKEAVDSATLIALIIFYFRQGLSKEEVFNKLNIVPTYKPFEKFNMTCSNTIDNCLYALYNSNSFEDAIKKVISMGGDTDTNACIVGSMAESLYGISDELKEKALEKLPEEFKLILKRYNKEKR